MFKAFLLKPIFIFLLTVYLSCSLKFDCIYLISANYVMAKTVTASESNLESELTPIMGVGSLTIEQMFCLLAQNNKQNGLNPLTDGYIKYFVLSIIDMAESEGVNYDIVYALIMHETGFLNYSGDVSPEQFNFGGLGATGSSEPGASFTDTKTGILAVVQHLKCYACDEDMINELVDPRFSARLRCVAPYVQWLGASDNPYHIGWASPGRGYGENLLNVIKRAKNVDTSNVNLKKIEAVDVNSSKQEQSEPISPQRSENSSYVKVLGLMLMLFCVSKVLKSVQHKKF